LSGKTEEIIIKFPRISENSEYITFEVAVLNYLASLESVPKIIATGKIQLTNLFGLKKKIVPYFIMSKIEGKPLHLFASENDQQFISLVKKGYSKEQLATIIGKILPAFADRLACIHERNVVHKDIKPTNALYNDDTGLVSILDFEHANEVGTKGRNDPATPYLTPLEHWLDPTKTEDVRSDIYSFGVTCFFLLAGTYEVTYGKMVHSDLTFSNQGMNIYYKILMQRGDWPGNKGQQA